MYKMNTPKCEKCNDTGKVKYKPIEDHMYSWDPWLERDCSCKSDNVQKSSRLGDGEAWMYCEDCMSKLYSFDGNRDRTMRCPHPQKCSEE